MNSEFSKNKHQNSKAVFGNIIPGYSNKYFPPFHLPRKHSPVESFSGLQSLWDFECLRRARPSLGSCPASHLQLTVDVKRAGEVAAHSRVGGSCSHLRAPEAAGGQEGLLVTLGREASPTRGNCEAMGCESCECVKGRTEVL